MGVQSESLKEINSCSPLEEDEVRLEGVVSLFCDPETYPTPGNIRRCSTQGVIPVIGIHPKKSIDEKGFSKLQFLLELPEVVGLSGKEGTSSQVGRADVKNLNVSLI
jgi:hypothetical protein